MQHLAGLHAYGVPDVPSGFQTRRASERKWIRIPIPATRRRAYGGEIPNLVQNLNKGIPTMEGERERDENLSQIELKKKGHPTPPYIGQGGVRTSLPFTT